MAKTKLEKIAGIEEEIRQLENRRKQLVQERKDRTKRLCRRMGLFESLVLDSIPLTEEQFKIFLEKTVAAEHSRRILAEDLPRKGSLTVRLTERTRKSEALKPDYPVS